MSTHIQSALQRLGVERLVLSLHQLSFPADIDDIGVGTPYSRKSRALMAFVRDLGFTGLGLGPGGITSRANPSPYDGTLFSLNPAFLALAPLMEAGLIEADDPWRSRADATRADHGRAFDVSRDVIRHVRARLRMDPMRYAAALAEVDLLARDPGIVSEAAFEGASASTGTDDWRLWPERPASHAAAADAFVVGQWLLRAQHARFREDARALGLQIYADAQIGVSHRDVFIHRGLFLADYRMGAPPSRTNPEGQPWGFPVLDPSQRGSARAFVDNRFAWLLSTHDGIRIDHPHGWVCPWVYRVPGGDDDEVRAVQSGARLFESPDLPDHAALARHARVRSSQIDRTRARHDDAWVTTLEEPQIDAYAEHLVALLGCARTAGVDERDLVVEVLSTCPRPLAAVLERCGLGRFRVTQKARVDVDADVYRSDSAGPLDWIMVGNHDTPPLRQVVDGWRGTAEGSRRAEYLARRLEPDASRRVALAMNLERDPHAMRDAMLADLFVGPARRVIVFWADLFGEAHTYNRPGVVHPDNWTMRMAPDFAKSYEAALAAGTAPRLERVLELALHARGLPASPWAASGEKAGPR